MDGLLLNTEDIYSLCANNVLAKYGRPPVPWSLKAQMMGVSGSSTGENFHQWAKLPISKEEWAKEQSVEQTRCFPKAELLPGVAKLLEDLKVSRTKASGALERSDNGGGKKVEIALATSSVAENFKLKMSRPEVSELFEIFTPERRILGDDLRLAKGRGKPRPDIYLLALEVINSSLPDGQPQITPEECLVFEDSVPGVEAGRRAGMRAVWVPHPGLAEEYRGREKEVLAGRSGLGDGGDEAELGQIDDGWAERLPSLENFPYEKYGIEIFR
ncbi:MAG: hypothetical protein MMC33_008936 [Icmadophila ericetorum]|nr:hypothetical protein [Icmadophila ericetorum]